MVILVILLILSLALSLYKWFYWKNKYKYTRHLLLIYELKLDEIKRNRRYF